MTKEDLKKELFHLSKESGIKTISIKDILNIERRTNKRFPSVVANFLEIRDGDLWLTCTEDSGPKWRYVNPTRQELQRAYKLLTYTLSEKVHIVINDEADDYDDSIRILIATRDAAKAREVFKRAVADAKRIARDKGWVTSSVGNSFETYLDEYAVRDHIYVILKTVALQ